jgi:hypothetical protein
MHNSEWPCHENSSSPCKTAVLSDNMGTGNVPEYYIYMYIAVLVNTIQWHCLFMKFMISITFLYLILYHYWECLDALCLYSPFEKYHVCGHIHLARWMQGDYCHNGRWRTSLITITRNWNFLVKQLAMHFNKKKYRFLSANIIYTKNTNFVIGMCSETLNILCYWSEAYLLVLFIGAVFSCCS